MKILKKKNFWISLKKKFGSAYAHSPRKCSNIEILGKIEGKEANFFSKIYEGFDLGKKKIKIISCLCTFNKKTPPGAQRGCDQL